MSGSRSASAENCGGSSDEGFGDRAGETMELLRRMVGTGNSIITNKKEGASFPENLRWEGWMTGRYLTKMLHAI